MHDAYPPIIILFNSHTLCRMSFAVQERRASGPKNLHLHVLWQVERRGLLR